jgi:DNA-binding response OmpR family regulator
MRSQLSLPSNGCQAMGPFLGLTNGRRTMATHPIILIDNDSAWLERVETVLREEGFAVETAEDGQHGLELLDHTAPVLVILNVHLPRLSGFDLLRELRRRGQQVPVLMVSSQDQAGLMAQALAEGASRFLRKPVAAELLLRAVHTLVDEWTMRKTKDEQTASG